MQYDEESLKKIVEKYSEVGRIHDQLMLRLFTIEPRLHEVQAKEYLLHGVARRLGILTRCIRNIFVVFPVGRIERLAREALTDVEINLHAFFVNISGLFDNLGWVFVIENNLFGSTKDGKLSKKDIGLFNKKTQSHLPGTVRTYLNSEHVSQWYSEYSKNYRDALAHRIPIYVPPFVLNDEEQKRYFALEEQKQKLDFRVPEDSSAYDQLCEQQEEIGKLGSVFTHSYGEKSAQVALHAQVIIDYLTIEEVINRTCEELWPTPR